MAYKPKDRRDREAGSRSTARVDIARALFNHRRQSVVSGAGYQSGFLTASHRRAGIPTSV